MCLRTTSVALPVCAGAGQLVPLTVHTTTVKGEGQQRHCCTQLSARQPGTLSQRSCSHASHSQSPQRSSPRQAQTLQASTTTGPGGDPHAGRSPEHQLQRHLGAPRQPPGCRRLALGLSGEREWDWDVGCVEGGWTGSGSDVRVVAGLSNYCGHAQKSAAACFCARGLGWWVLVDTGTGADSG
jgi:hypothetical protein